MQRASLLAPAVLPEEPTPIGIDGDVAVQAIAVLLLNLRAITVAVRTVTYSVAVRVVAEAVLLAGLVLLEDTILGLQFRPQLVRSPRVACDCQDCRKHDNEHQ